MSCQAVNEHGEVCPESLANEGEPLWEDWCPWCKEQEEPPGAGADPYGRTAEDWARHAE